MICLVVLVAIGILFLLLPVTYSFKGKLNSDPSFFFIGKLWRLVGVEAKYKNHKVEPRILVLGKSFAIKEKGKYQNKTDEEKEPKRKNQHHKSNWISNVTMKQIHATLSLGKDIISLVSPKLFLIEGKVGFPEPHLTSYMIAGLSQIKSRPGIRINIQPIWIEECCDLELGVTGRIIPLQILWRGICYVLSRPIRKIWLGKLQSLSNKLDNR